jgi:hypothetical protein
MRLVVDMHMGLRCIARGIVGSVLVEKSRNTPMRICIAMFTTVISTCSTVPVWSIPRPVFSFAPFR